METEIICLILGVAALTFLTRFAFAVAFKKLASLPKWNRWLMYVPVAVFTTIIVPALLLPRGWLDLSIYNEYLIAGVAAVLVAYKTRNLAGTVVVGIATVLLLRFVFGC